MKSCAKNFLGRIVQHHFESVMIVLKTSFVMMLHFRGLCNQNSMVYNAWIVVRLWPKSLLHSKKKPKQSIFWNLFSSYASKDEAHYLNNRALCRTSRRRYNDQHTKGRLREEGSATFLALESALRRLETCARLTLFS